jgi:hypothetical protein
VKFLILNLKRGHWSLKAFSTGGLYYRQTTIVSDATIWSIT